MYRSLNLNKNNKSKLNMIRFIPMIIMLISFIFFTINYKNISISDILSFTPENHLLAGGIIILIYAVKSISMFVSLSILYVSVGIIFPVYEALTINFIGIIVSMILPYFIGRLSGKGLFYKVAEKYPKIYKINDIEKDSEWRFIFIIKFIGIIPNEISSLTFGILNINFTSYMIASILAKTPAMIVTTLIGSNINEPGSLGFIASIIMSIIILIIVLRIYIKCKDNFK